MAVVVDGVDLGELEARTGRRLETLAERWLADCLAHGLLTLGAERVLRTTPTGLTRLDSVLRAFVTSRPAPGEKPAMD